MATTVQTERGRFCYAWHGPRDRPPIVAIGGLTDQLDHWPEAWAPAFAAQGHPLLVFDARDTGLSDHLDHLSLPSAKELALIALGLPSKHKALYTLGDMAEDVRAITHSLGVPSFHVIGYSMGGQVAQALALAHPQAVLSMTLLFSTSGVESLPLPPPSLFAALLGCCSRAADEARAVGDLLKLLRLTRSPVFGQPENELEQAAQASVRRAYRPEGVARHLHAVLTSEPVAPRLGTVGCPTLVLQGGEDPFFSAAHGADLARRIPGARLESIPDAGHALEPAIAQALADAVLRNVSLKPR